MNEQPVPTPRTGPRERIRAQVTTFRSRQHGMFGPAEIITLAASLLILVLVIVAYLYFLVPARSRLANAQLERARLQTQLRNSQAVVQEGQTTETTVQTITQSLDTFEGSHLLTAARGRMSLYDSLNSLIRKNGLRNTSGPTYTPLESTENKSSSGSKAASAKWKSVYPGVAISLTVEGSYQNVRRFVRDLESNRQFVIINSVELERSTETNSAPPTDGTTSGGPRGSLVSLRLEMATYFQRGSANSVAVEAGAN